jgi:hypothetical protein
LLKLSNYFHDFNQILFSFKKVLQLIFHFIRPFQELNQLSCLTKLYVFQFLFSDISVVEAIISQPLGEGTNENRDFAHFNPILSQFFYNIEKSFILNTKETIYESSIALNIITNSLVRYFQEENLLNAAKCFFPFYQLFSFIMIPFLNMMKCAFYFFQ